MKAIILAAGKGVRLDPLTQRIAKPLLPIAGEPIILQQLRALSSVGIHEAHIVRGPVGEPIHDHLEDFIRQNLPPRISVQFRIQEVQHGMVHAVRTCIDLFDEEDSFDGDVIVMAADTLFGSDQIQALIDMHQVNEADVTLSVRPLPLERLPRSSNVALGSDWHVLFFREKPHPEDIEGDLSAAPLYLFSPHTRKYLEESARSSRGEFEIATAVTDMMDAGMCVVAITTDVEPQITNVWDLLRENFPYLQVFE